MTSLYWPYTALKPTSTDMVERELGPDVAGMLFGKPFNVELCKHAASFTTLKKVENSLKRVF